METTYIIAIVILFILAISDLIVGVSNDAVNFLNSAIGSKAAKRTTIMIIAALGVFVGATFSSGMMEVARKGIFNPQFFTFSEIMTIYLAVMLTDILLLDGFNRLGFPTSTTVSIVFEILGGALALAIVKINNDPDALSLAEYINTSKALAIISGILLSVVVAFSVGAVVQWFVRYIFSFNFNAKIKYFGAIYGGLAITVITYFMLIKGAKGASFMNDDIKILIQENTMMILLVCFVAWTIITQLLVWLFKINILKVIVLVGTFALAMAFAGNDLVNFIGVPLAGLASFNLFQAAPAGATPETFVMTGLTGKVATDTYLLIIAGVIMIVTLWFSKKARRVIATGIDLSRQGDGEERFESSVMARSIVRASHKFGMAVDRIVPRKFKNSIEKQFDTTQYIKRMEKVENPPAFDLIRASVNLIVASILISFATSLKLPLSTTYVTFMVAMGTSLSDKAWDRESAVFRITGVFTVIGGWFLTAFIALTVAFIFANIINLAGIWAVIALFAIAMFLFIKGSKEKSEEEIDSANETDDVTAKYKVSINKYVDAIREIQFAVTKALINEDYKTLDKQSKNAKQLSVDVKELKDKMYRAAKTMDESLLETGLYHVQALDFLREAAHAIDFISTSCFKHIANNHKPLTDMQRQELTSVCAMSSDFMSKSVAMLNERNFEDINTVKTIQLDAIKLIKESTKAQIKRLKQAQGHTRASMLYLYYMQETKNILLETLNVVKLQRDADRTMR
jgi:phosphate/sulfate permease